MPLNIIRQDITKMNVDAIVNTTNEEMTGYSGVDLAIHEGAGPELDKECSAIAPLGLGDAVITYGYNLKAKYIIHTSGPVWQGGLMGERILLKSCYEQSLKLALKYNIESIAFPLISSGVYGYPKDEVLKYAVKIISEFLKDHELNVYLCVYDKTSYSFSKELFSEITDYLNEDGCVEKRAFESAKNKYSSIGHKTKTETDIIETCASPYSEQDEISLKEYMKNMDKSFAYKLFDLIDNKGMTDVECYKKANVDKKTFSKIKCNPNTYKPSKQTAVAFAIALELTLDETQDLLASAGLTLSQSFTFDKIIRFFIKKQIYDIFEINEALFEFDQILLGC